MKKISEKGIAVNNFGIGLDAAIVHATNHSSTKAIEQIQLRIIFVFILYSPCFIHSKGFPILVDAGGNN